MWGRGSLSWFRSFWLFLLQTISCRPVTFRLGLTSHLNALGNRFLRRGRTLMYVCILWVMNFNGKVCIMGLIGWRRSKSQDFTLFGWTCPSLLHLGHHFSSSYTNLILHNLWHNGKWSKNTYKFKCFFPLQQPTNEQWTLWVSYPNTLRHGAVSSRSSHLLTVSRFTWWD